MKSSYNVDAYLQARREDIVEIRQPNSRHCFVCGLENPFGLKLKFYQSKPDEVVVDCVLGEEYQGYPGVVHGGIVAAVLDEVAGRSQMGIDTPRFMYTARLDIRYRKNVPVGQKLHLVGKAGKKRKRTAAATGAIYGPDGELLAEADALLVQVPEDMIQSVDLDTLGWKVYPDEAWN
jgi:acyl-coenzyme A thioesterase PaaI-like protein